MLFGQEILKQIKIINSYRNEVDEFYGRSNCCGFRSIIMNNLTINNAFDNLNFGRMLK